MYSSGNYLSWPRRREWKTIIFPSQECKRFDDSIVNFLTNFLYRLFLPTKFVWLYDEYSILLLKSWSCVVTYLYEEDSMDCLQGRVLITGLAVLPVVANTERKVGTRKHWRQTTWSTMHSPYQLFSINNTSYSSHPNLFVLL